MVRPVSSSASRRDVLRSIPCSVWFHSPPSFYGTEMRARQNAGAKRKGSNADDRRSLVDRPFAKSLHVALEDRGVLRRVTLKKEQFELPDWSGREPPVSEAPPPAADLVAAVGGAADVDAPPTAGRCAPRALGHARDRSLPLNAPAVRVSMTSGASQRRPSRVYSRPAVEGLGVAAPVNRIGPRCHARPCLSQWTTGCVPPRRPPASALALPTTHNP